MYLFRIAEFNWWRLLNEVRERLTKKQNFETETHFLLYLFYSYNISKLNPTDDRICLPSMIHKPVTCNPTLLHCILQPPTINAEREQLCNTVDSCLMGEVESSGHTYPDSVLNRHTNTKAIRLKWFCQKINLEIQNSFGETTPGNLDNSRLCSGENSKIRCVSKLLFKKSIKNFFSHATM